MSWTVTRASSRSSRRACTRFSTVLRYSFLAQSARTVQQIAKSRSKSETYRGAVRPSAIKASRRKAPTPRPRRSTKTSTKALVGFWIGRKRQVQKFQRCPVNGIPVGRFSKPGQGSGEKGWDRDDTRGQKSKCDWCNQECPAFAIPSYNQRCEKRLEDESRQTQINSSKGSKKSSQAVARMGHAGERIKLIFHQDSTENVIVMMPTITMRWR